MPIEHITLPNGKLPPVAPYSHAVRAGEFLFVTGQLPEDPESGELMLGPIVDQTRRVMENLRLVLEHAGTSFANVVSARIFLTDFRDYDEVNAIYASYFESDRLPCRTTVGVLGLAARGNIEIDAIVYCGQ